jgi:hypothetical protein
MTASSREPWSDLGIEDTTALDLGETIAARTFARAARPRPAVGSIHRGSLPHFSVGLVSGS